MSDSTSTGVLIYCVVGHPGWLALRALAKSVGLETLSNSPRCNHG